MLPSIAQRVVRMHPGVQTLILVAGFVAPLIVAFVDLPALVQGLLLTLPIAAACGWIWAIFEAAGRRLGWTALWARLLFLAPVVVVLVAGTAGWSMRNSPTAYAFFALFFVNIGLASWALERAVQSEARPGVGQILLTALLMYLTLVGVWMLRPKILRVANRTFASEPA